MSPYFLGALRAIALELGGGITVAEGPKRVALTEAFHEAMSRQRLVAAVFLTYRFDPGFFEQEVLLALFDRPFSTSDENVKLAQLEAVLQGWPGSVAVYYDANGLTGGEEPDEEGRRPRKLLAACLSANLTQ